MRAGVPPDAAHHFPADLPAVQQTSRPGAAVSHLRHLQGGTAEADQLQADHQSLSQAATGQI